MYGIAIDFQLILCGFTIGFSMDFPGRHGSTGTRRATDSNRPVQPNQPPSTRRLRGEYAGIGVSGAGLEARQVDLARLHKHGSTGTALQARPYRHGSTGTALQSRLYRNGSAGTSLHRHGSTGTALQARAGQQTQIGRRSQINTQVRGDYAVSTPEWVFLALAPKSNK